MKLNEKGFTITELLVVLPIFALLGVAAMVTIFQISHLNGHNYNYMTSVRQAENAGYWISRDAQMAQVVKTDNLTPLVFLDLGWTEWDSAGNPIYHTVNYSFEGLTDGIGTLKRSHSSNGVNQQTLIAQHIYYNSANTTYTSRATLQDAVLTLKLTTLLPDETLESREYQIVRRINY